MLREKLKKSLGIAMIGCLLSALGTFYIFPAKTAYGQTSDAGSGSSVSSAVYGDPQVNLALHKPVAIEAPYTQLDRDQYINNYGLESDHVAHAYKLTDGRYGNLGNWQSTADWFVFYRKLQRIVTVDLEQVNTVNSIAIGFGQNDDVGIVPPINVRFYVSNDGADYRYLGLAEPDVPLYYANYAGNSLHRKVYKLDQLNVQARYVKLVFTIATFGWTDEIEIMGQEGIVNGAVLPESRPDHYETNRFAERGVPESAEITNQFLWYSGPMTNPYFTDWTKEKVKSFLAYMDLNGDIRDWYFDDLLVMPVTAMLTPSTSPPGAAAVYKTKEDMLTFLNFIFTQDETQLSAINAAVGEINAKLGTNKKVRLNMAIPYLTKSSNFGDIFGDGSTLSFDPADFRSRVPDPNSPAGKQEMERLALENKKLAVKWYIDEVERRFNEAGYTNLYLNSFYWYGERLYEQDGDVQLIQATADYLKSKGYYFTWIPYLGLNQAYVWRDLGFTTAAIQPNYAFKYSKKDVIRDVSRLAQKVGSSVEIEYDDFRTLLQYLNQGYKEGFMTQTYNTYYMAAMPIAEGAYAFTPFDANKHDSLAQIRRAVYDRVYEYVKGTYVPRYGMNLVTNVADKSNIAVRVMLPLADSFVAGQFSVHYDADKVDYTGFTLPAALMDKGTFTVDAAQPGLLNIRFTLTNPNDAITHDLQAKQSPLTGAPELLTLKFAKKEGVDDQAITARLFVTDEDGQMIDKDGMTYLNFTASDIVPGSLADLTVQAHKALLKAEATRDETDKEIAMELALRLPDGHNKTSFIERLNAIPILSPILVEQLSPEQEFYLGEEAKVTVKATNQTAVHQNVTVVVALYDKTNGQAVTYSAIEQQIEAGKSVQATGMIKLPNAGQYEVRVLVWDTLDHQKPLSEPIILPVTARTTPDATPPTAPSELQAAAVSEHEIDLSWTPSTDNVGVAGYKVFRNGIEAGATSSTSYRDSGLTDATTYSYTVKAYDAAGNVSAASDSRSATTATTVAIMQSLIDRYEQSGDLSKSLKKKLTNSLQQAEDHWNKGHANQAIKHMQDFLKHLEKKGQEDHISEEAKSALTIRAEVMIGIWSR